MLIHNINNNYDFKVIGIIKINEHLYKLKTNQGFFCLKEEVDSNISVIYNHINTLDLRYFCKVILNRQHQVVTNYNEFKYYIMEYLQQDDLIIKSLKIKEYLKIIARLHRDSFFNHKVDQELFDTQKKDIINTIKERYRYYESLINQQHNDFLSPSQWMLLMHYRDIVSCLKRARNYLNDYYENVKDANFVRLSLTYNNFNYDHIYVRERKLISIDNIKINFCISDILNVYQNIDNLDADYDSLLHLYFKEITLLPEELKLLKVMLSIVPIIKITDDEISNIIKVTRLLSYIDATSNLDDLLID